jgi:hypothetical protein
MNLKHTEVDMALQTALKFLERVEREESLRAQLYISSPEDLRKLTEFARGKGFVVSLDDMAQAVDQYKEKFPTGSIAPLKKFVQEYKSLPGGK